MKNKEKSNRIYAVVIVLMALICLPFIIASLVVLFEPIIVWLFLGIILLFTLSVEALFDRSVSKRESLPMLIVSFIALISFWYFALR